MNRNKIALPLVLIFAFLTGILITRQYGESWDELQFYKYAGHALESYSAWHQRGEIIVTGNTYDNYGPAFVIFTSGIASFLHTLNPNWLVSDYRHLVYFFTFLAGVWAFHDIAKRWMGQTAAFAATVLFLTQPLFWGHAFFSPKDIPFMSLFLLSVAFGFRMIDSAQPISFESLTSFAKRTLAILIALWLASVFGLFLATDVFHSIIGNLVRSAASGEINIISYIASDLHKVEPEVYIQKYFALFIQARANYFYLSTSLLIYIYYRILPSSFSLLLSVIPAAIVLGLASSTRILGPLAGLIIAYYAYRTKGKNIFPALLMYAVIALIIMYVTWPYLWPNPLGQLFESFKVMSQYPWKGQVLFNGHYYSSTELPLSYIPLLLILQFTEPAWLLFIMGIFTLRKNNIMFVTSLLWFILPLLALIITRAPLYDNTRQIFFILPPVFFVAGLGVDHILGWVSRPIAKVGIVCLLILPSLVAGVRLHPYEYVYYNSLAGNPIGRFELDYWAASYREAANWLNENAPTDAEVVVGDPVHIAELYLRKDLKAIPASEFVNSSQDYVLYSTRYQADENFFIEYETVHEIERDGLIFAVIKKLR